MSDGATIAFFPEAAYGPALNSVGIAQVCRDRGHEPVFICDPSMEGVFEDYGFEEHYVPMSDPDADAGWEEFINTHIPNFDKDPIDQLDNYVEETYDAIVASAEWAETELPEVLDEIDPDLIVVDNVILYPSTKQYGVPWVRITSCSENEIPDPNIPPHLSGARADDVEHYHEFQGRYEDVIEDVHERFNDFLEEHGEDPYPRGLFYETSPYLNLLKYPERLRWDRWNELDPDRFQYLNGCIREENESYEVPDLDAADDAPLLYLSFGSLGAGDTDLMKRLIEFLGTQEYRCLVNVGDYEDAYDDFEVPGNVAIESWFPQQTVIDRADVVIHHGGNNTFNECLYYGTPAIVMPYVWDGHDNATRVDETDHGVKLHRSDWTDDELAGAIETCLTDETIRENVDRTAEDMQSSDGRKKAATLFEDVLETHG
ncbi:glycosyltransferase [Halopenitus sp. POP-27]|uniref:glycosyltransferase n=1 Tax=Halopenitus sp. POP-27 TaxID=2994425 RepID=UPI002469C0FB|nr:glycosyltransferase [Halopenitus sp. POP-27]